MSYYIIGLLLSLMSWACSDDVETGLSLKPWGIALKFLFLHHENILFPND